MGKLKIVRLRQHFWQLIEFTNYHCCQQSLVTEIIKKHYIGYLSICSFKQWYTVNYNVPLHISFNVKFHKMWHTVKFYFNYYNTFWWSVVSMRDVSVKHMSHSRTKPTKWPVRPAKTQISQGIHPVWSESSMSVLRIAKDLWLLHADSEDSDQTGRIDAQADLSLCWAHRSFCWFCHEAAHFLPYTGSYPGVQFFWNSKTAVAQQSQ